MKKKRHMDTVEHAVRGVNSEVELGMANALMAGTQAPPDAECMRWLETTGPRWPGITPSHTRVLYIGAEMAGALRIQPLKLRVGRARLTAGGIGWVSTKAAYRNRGVCAALMRDALDFMTRSGFLASLLFGIPNLYQKYGFVTMLPEHTITIGIGERPPAAPCLAPVTWDDARTLRRLHDKDEDCVSCSIVRDARYFETLYRCASHTIRYYPDWASTVKVLDAKGHAVAYLMPQAGQDVLHIKELGVKGPAHFETVLEAAFALARGHGRDRVRFHLPPSHPFAVFLRDYSCEHLTQTFRNAEGMMKLLHVQESLCAMIPEWEARLEEAAMPRSRVELVLSVEQVTCRIACRRGKVHVERTDDASHVRVTSQLLCRLLVGFSSGSDVATSHPGLRVEQRRLLSCLFPLRVPFVWPIDHF